MSTKTKTKERLAMLDSMGLGIAKATPLKVMPTRVRELNDLLPNGLPFGKVTLAYGPNASHKTSVMVEAVGDEQHRDPDHICLFVPAERGDDLAYYEDHLNLILDQTVVLPPDDKGFYMMEHVLQKICDAIQSGAINSVILDSWDALVANKEIYTTDGAEKSVTKETVGAKAAVSSKMWRKMKSLIADNDVMFGVICQSRTKGLGSYVVTEGFSGGKSLEHNADLVIYQKAIRQVKKKVNGQEQPWGQTIRFELKKIRVGGRSKNLYKQQEVDYEFGEDWDVVSGTFDSAVGKGIIIKTPGGYIFPTYPENGKGIPKLRSLDAAKDFFKSDSTNMDVLGKVVDYFDNHDYSSDLDEDELLNQNRELVKLVTNSKKVVKKGTKPKDELTEEETK